MELSGSDELISRFLADTDAHRFDGWMPEFAEDNAAMVFRSRTDAWTMRIKALLPIANGLVDSRLARYELELTVSGVDGTVRCRVITGTLGATFAWDRSWSTAFWDTRPAVLAISRQ